MDRSRTVELMPIVLRLGTGKVYRDCPPEQDFAAVVQMGRGVIPLLIDWLDDECRIVQRGAARALDHLAANGFLPDKGKAISVEVQHEKGEAKAR